MSQSTHQVAIKGVDQTAGAFNSVAARAKATGAQIRSVMGGALAAAGAYLSFRSIKGAVDELGKLSDLAMKSGTSVDELTKSATAFQVAGLNLPVETLAKSFQYLKKQTGEGGIDNFYKVAESIAAIEDPAQRGAELVKNFGRAGLELQPLVEGGASAIEKMRALTDLMPGVSQAAANAGDEAADSLTILGKGATSLFQKAVGKIIGMWGEDFPGGVRAGALNAYNAIETFARKAWAWIQKLGTKIGAFAGFLSNVWDVGFSEAADIYADQLADADKIYEAAVARADKMREDYKAKLRTVDVKTLANAFGGKGRNGASSGTMDASAGGASAPRISNELIMAGSNQAQRLAAIGPQVNLQRRTNELLQQVVDNTAKTADNTEGAADAYETTDL